MPQTKPTRILIISDTHAGFTNSDDSTSPHYASPAFSFRPPFPAADILIHSGDTTMLGRPAECELALEMLSSIPAELKLVIAGNHELSLDKRFYLEEMHRSGRMLQAQSIDYRGYDPAHAETAEKLWTGEAARKAGVTYLTEGLYRFALRNGVEFTVYASPWQPEFYNWAFNYPHHEDRWNPLHLVSRESGAMKPEIREQTVPAPADRDPHPMPEGAVVDIVMTHGPPYMHLDRCANGTRAGCPHLLSALNRVRPRLACFGHIHEGWGAERCTWRDHDPSSKAVKDDLSNRDVTGGLNGMTMQSRELQRETSSARGPLGEEIEVLGAYGVRAKGSESGAVQYAADRAVVEQRAAVADVSASSQRPLQFGKETIMVNSSIMDVSYRPRGAPWLITLDLPLAS